ncbi:MAG: aspartate kinase [Candidatus Helarchaeota archaeon]
MQELVVHKFGGSCLKDATSFHKTLKIVDKFRDRKMVFVCSALSKMTDYLLETATGVSDHHFEVESRINAIKERHFTLIDEVLLETSFNKDAKEFLERTLKRLSNTLYGVWEIGLTSRSLDFILSFGERLSTYIFYDFLKERGEQVKFFSGDTLIYTNGVFNNALPLFSLTEKTILEKIEPVLQADKIPVVTGYISSNQEGHVTTLGRGGSDLTATLVAYSLKIPNRHTYVILWKDVDGLLTANPKFEPNAKLIKNISYAEARELAYFGSKILHPLCIFPMEQKELPIQIRNFNSPDKEEFTVIEAVQEKASEIVKAITVQEVAMVTVESDAMVSLPGTAAKVFDTLGKSHINVAMISQGSSENNITFLVERTYGKAAEEVLKQSKFFGEQWFNIKLEPHISLIAIVGAGMAYTPGVAGRIFTALGNAKVNVRAIAQGSSEINISIAVESTDVARGVQAIHKEFNLGD